VNVLTQRKDDSRKQGTGTPARVGESEPVVLPEVLLEDLGNRMLEVGHAVTPA
jgi:hypothetical protein